MGKHPHTDADAGQRGLPRAGRLAGPRPRRLPASHREAHGFGDRQAEDRAQARGRGYRNVNACVADIRRIWSNCKRYNGEGSDFYDLADRLSKQLGAAAKAKAEAKGDRDGRRRRGGASRSGEKDAQSVDDVAADLVCQ